MTGEILVFVLARSFKLPSKAGMLGSLRFIPLQTLHFYKMSA
ncbi:hypothetical protein BPUTEOMOX_2418 [methanotrophic endosymbiont of Bathymodiolus puteoserpentis (Logatchev)]|nr:hypothetical protein BPUTEOMOX_2418 [methanotrophic endosymbiont of Bathymodiolus puteoserpentis (Logatchev)]